MKMTKAELKQFIFDYIYEMNEDAAEEFSFVDDDYDILDMVLKSLSEFKNAGFEVAE